MGKISLAIEVLSVVLGLLDKDEKLEDMGDKAIQAKEAGINPEDFATYKEYAEAIKNFEVDPKNPKNYLALRKW